METGGMNFLFYLLHMIVQSLSGKLSWSHFVELIKIDDPLQREFYTGMCRLAANTLIRSRTPDRKGGWGKQPDCPARRCRYFFQGIHFHSAYEEIF